MPRLKAYPFLTALLLAGLVLPQGAAAQYADGQKYLGVHVGLSGVGSSATLGVNGEMSYNNRISVGAWADYWSYGETFGAGLGTVDWDVSYIALAGTGAYHFPISSQPKLDPFLGVAVGYFIVNTSATGVTGVDYGGDASRLFVGGFGGARWFFSQSMAGVARLGFGASYLTLGLDFRF